MKPRGQIGRVFVDQDRMNEAVGSPELVGNIGNRDSVPDLDGGGIRSGVARQVVAHGAEADDFYSHAPTVSILFELAPPEGGANV